VLLAEMVDRFVRSGSYVGLGSRGEEPAAVEMETLVANAGGVPLYTKTPPDGCVRKNHGARSKPGKGGRGHKGGRGNGVAARQHQQDLREDLLPELLKLLAGGLSQRAIAKRLGVSQGTVSNWLRWARSERDGKG